jgi:hypothetical protein
MTGGFQRVSLCNHEAQSIKPPCRCCVRPHRRARLCRLLIQLRSRSEPEMPQPRQRIVFCDCLDCVQQPPTTDIRSSSSAANEAAARQEPPPKCLMFVLSGVLLPTTDAQNLATATVLDKCNLPHLNRATAQGNLCLLTLRQDAAAGVPTTALPRRHSSILHNLLSTRSCLCVADSCTELEQLLCMYQVGSHPCLHTVDITQQPSISRITAAASG